MRSRPAFVVRLVAAALLVGAGSVGCDGDAADPTGQAATAPSEAGTPDAVPPGDLPEEAEENVTGTGEIVVHSTQVPDLHPSVDDYPDTVLEIATTDGTVHRLAVKVASTQQQRAHGFMEVPEVPAGTGMWFTYEDDRTGGFWMKDTRVPLDIAYVAADGRIHTILTMQPCEADPCPSYPPEAAYRWALEVPAGWFASVDVSVGDHVAVAV